MATSRQLRVQKPESVHFWLCVGAVSLALHSSLLFGLERWAKVTIVQPDGGPIAVELMDASDAVRLDAVGPNSIGLDAVAFPTEPDAIAQVPQTPDAKPDSQPEVKLEVQPDVQPEAEVVRKPEPKRESNVPIVPKPEQKTKSKPSFSAPTQAKPSISTSPKLKPSSSSSSGNPKNSSGQLPVQGTQGADLSGKTGTTGVGSFEVRGDNPQQLDGDRPATLQLMPFSPITLSRNFAKDVGKTVNVSVTFIVKCLKSQGLTCQDIQIEWQSHTPPSGLSAAYDQELETAITNWFQTIKATSLVYKPDPKGTTSAAKKPDSFWNIQITLQVKN